MLERMEKPPLSSAVALSVLTAMTVAERTPEFQTQSAAVVQAPMRRHEDQDEAHNEAVTEQRVVQGQEQAPPPVTAPVLQARSSAQQMFDESARLDAEVAAIHQAQSVAQKHRNAFVVTRLAGVASSEAANPFETADTMSAAVSDIASRASDRHQT